MSRSRRNVGTREWELDVLEHVDGHARAEGAMLAEYAAVVDDEAASPAFRYLARLILEDEVRHHRFFDELGRSMRETMSGDEEGSGVPSLRGLGDDRFRIERVTERLLEAERADHRELRQLARRLRDFDRTTLWGLLIELMIDDTKRHIKILEFLRDRSLDQPD